MNYTKGKKIGHSLRSTLITVLVLAAVILLNVGVSALCSELLWYVDMTSKGDRMFTKMYTLDSATTDYLRLTFDEVNAKRAEEGEEAVKVKLVFCADPDMLKANERMRYVYYTALCLQKAFPDTVEVVTENVWLNPSAVDDYRTNSYSSIYQSSVIVASGTEFRVTTIDTYYTFDTETTGDPWAYNGEKKFVQSIIAVTKAESPICAITTNHGEPFATEEGRAQYSELLKVIKNAGYRVAYLDLEREEIPADCRLILTFDPQTDFVSSFQSATKTSETKKLDAFLEKAYSFMVFVDADTPVLTNLEEYLEQWGIAFDRYTDPLDEAVTGNFQISADSALGSEKLTVIGEYATEALGGSITKNMREYGGSPKVVFGNAMSISYAYPEGYDQTFVLADAEAGTGAFKYGSYYRNHHSRSIYDIFTSGQNSLAYAVKDGERVNNGDPVHTKGNYRLMTLTRESRTVGEGKGYTNVNDASNVCAIGSTQFADNKILSSNAYGNTDVLLETLRAIGREVVPVGLEFKPIYSAEMTQSNASTGEAYYTQGGNVAWTVVLALIPTLGFAISGIVILVKRRART